MRSRPLLLMLATAAVLALAVALATAATPGSGKVSKATPSVTWSGTLVNSAVAFNAFNQDPSAPCAPGPCDTFSLEVADGPANLELIVNLDSVGSDGTEADAGFRITRPDGKQEFVSGPSGPDKAFKHVIKNAANGKYVVDTVNIFVGTPNDYAAKATLLIPGAATTGGTSPTSTPSNPPPANNGGQNGTQPGPAGTPAPSPKLTVKAGKASAKKLAKAKKLVVALQTTGPLTKVAAVLRKGKATVGKGTLAKLDSTGKVTVKISKKLKAGSYKLTVQGLDAQNRTVTAQATVKVTK